MDDQLIQLKEVTKTFGKNKVLDAINLSIPEGKITGIIGASGEGKSTILKLIASFYKPTSGEALYFRRNVNKDSDNIKKAFGLAIEDGSFYENLTVYENLFHFGRLYKIKRTPLKRRIEGIVYFIGLDSAKNVLAKNLSLGMKKRLDLACALVHKPSVLILDEPTADLDPLLRAHMLKIIKKINSHGTTIIFTTQILEEVDVLCDHVAILYNEKIVEEGETKNILKKYNAKDMNKVFTSIFSKRGRKTYQESTTEKSSSDLPKQSEVLKNNQSAEILKQSVVPKQSEASKPEEPEQREMPEQREEPRQREMPEPEVPKQKEFVQELGSAPKERENEF